MSNGERAPGPWSDAPALGFDLGETLLTYRDTTLSWAELYGQALQSVAAKLGRELTAENRSAAEAILVRFNTRSQPRTVEVSAEIIFTEILEARDCSGFPR